MSHSLNQVTLIGNLGRDAETKQTGAGVSVVNFSVATSKRWKPKDSEEWKEKVNWTNVVFWRGEKVAPFLLKGKQVCVVGEIETRSYEDKDGKKVYATEVVAQNVILLGGKSESAGNVRGAEGPAAGEGITDDEIPF